MITGQAWTGGRHDQRAGMITGWAWSEGGHGQRVGMIRGMFSNDTHSAHLMDLQTIKSISANQLLL